jgi:hypothetical protein
MSRSASVVYPDTSDPCPHAYSIVPSERYSARITSRARSSPGKLTADMLR